MQNLHDFTRGAALNDYVVQRQLAPKTDAELMQLAPSIFADAPHASRSARYAYIPTVKVLDGLRSAGFVPVFAKQSRARIADRADFTKHLVRFTHTSAAQMVRVGDSIPQLVLTNSHDGSSSYELSLGFFRFACSNGLMVAEGDFSSIKVSHVGKIVDRVIEGSFEVINQADGAIERVEDFRKIELLPQEQEAFARAALTVKYDNPEKADGAPITAAQVNTARRGADKGQDLWSTLNRVQENLVKGGVRYRQNGRRMSTRGVNGIDGDTSLNRALWRLADEMRALKAAA